MDPSLLPPPRAASRRLALAHGLTDGAIAHRIGTGRWQRLYPGTYAPFSGPVPRMVWFDAAVQYAGAGAALSHQTAACCQGWRPDPGIIHVTVPEGRKVAPQQGLHVHRSRNWSSADVGPGAIACTTPERTLLDLVAASPSSRVPGLVTDALRTRVTTPERVLVAASQRQLLRHRALLVGMVAEAAGGVESFLEHEFAGVLRRHGILEPRRQVKERLRNGRGVRLDTLFDPYPVVAELNGRLGHTTAADLASDEARANAHALSGRIPLSFGWVRVLGQGCVVGAEVVLALWAKGWPGQPHACGSSCELEAVLSTASPRATEEAGVELAGALGDGCPAEVLQRPRPAGLAHRRTPGRGRRAGR